MIDFIFLFLIIIALGVICYIILKKFFQVSNLDLASLAEEKTNRKKKEIIASRLDEKGKMIKGAWGRRLAPLVQLWKKKQLAFRVYVGKVERLFRHEQTARARVEHQGRTVLEQEKEIGELLLAADNCFKDKDWDKAEELYISAIKIDNKSVAAYRGLAETYLAKGEREEAVQTFNFLSQLTPQDDNLFIRLGEIFEEQGNLEKAIQYYEQAVVLNDAVVARFYHLAELLMRIKQPETAMEAIKHAVAMEPKNPKYLDLLIECAIICDMVDTAEAGYEELRLVNPENHKLEEYKEKISQLGQKDKRK